MSGRWELRLASSTPRKTCFYKTTRVDQIVLSSNVERGLFGTVGRVVVSHSAFNSGSECSGEDK